jgi:hypothetical protein
LPHQPGRNGSAAGKHFDLHVVVVLQDAAGHRTIKAYTIHVGR